MKKKRIITICAVVLVILAVSAFYLNRAAIFQRGNPIPYLTSAIQISEKNPYVAVDETKGIYISKRGECPELFDYFCEKTGMEFVEQAGSGYLFTDGDRNDVISSEAYWGRYTVWTIPDIETVNREQNAVAPNKCLDEVVGNITFYEEPVKEAQNVNGTVTVRLSCDLNEEQADKLKDILDDVDEWVDDHTVDRLAYCFDGDFELSDREHSYYFTYEYNVIYYDHYYAEISAEDMQYIKDLGVECVELPDLHTPILRINDILYYDTSETGPMGAADAVEGYIQTSVQENEIPAENEESNFGCVGNAYTKDSGNGWIMVLMDDEEWHIFKRKEAVGN